MIRKKPTLDSTIPEIIGRPPVNGDFGIEIEWEGTNLIWPSENSIYWNNKEDGSLRNGREFVSRGVQKIEALPVMLTELERLTRNSKLVYSNRTSVHIHFNVSNLRMKDVVSIITLHFLVEKLLINSQGVDRKGNLFCLGVAEAEGQFIALKDNLKRNCTFNRFGPDGFKYAALNLSAINNYGSLEWRFLRGITDLKEISIWTRGLVEAAKVASLYTPQDIVNFFRFHDSREFLLKFFPENLLEMYIFPQVPLWRQMLLDNFPYAYELSKLVNKLSEVHSFSRPLCHPYENDILTTQEPF